MIFIIVLKPSKSDFHHSLESCVNESIACFLCKSFFTNVVFTPGLSAYVCTAKVSLHTELACCNFKKNKPWVGGGCRLCCSNYWLPRNMKVVGLALGNVEFFFDVRINGCPTSRRSRSDTPSRCCLPSRTHTKHFFATFALSVCLPFEAVKQTLSNTSNCQIH